MLALQSLGSRLEFHSCHHMLKDPGPEGSSGVKQSRKLGMTKVITLAQLASDKRTKSRLKH